MTRRAQRDQSALSPSATATRLWQAAAALALLGGAAAAAPPQAIFFNATVHTLEDARPPASAIAVRGDRIAAVGSEAEVLALKDDATQLVDLNGMTVLPGLIDAHGHMAGLGSFALGLLDLSDARDAQSLVTRVADAARAKPAGAWITGGRWNHENWPDKQLPTHAALSAATPDHPAWLRRVDGHAGLANAAAMQLAGITRDTPAPPGGEILRDARGEPTGVFVDNAMDLIEARLPAAAASPQELLLAAQKLCLQAGLTGVHDAGLSAGEVDAYDELERAGTLKLRIYGMVHGAIAIEYFKAHELRRGPRLTVRACKLYADGALGSRGAWLLEPYSDRPRDAEDRPYTGLAVMRPELIRHISRDALQRGYQVCTHAIGDRGNREVLDAYAAALQERPSRDHRFRIEHAQILSPADIPRFAQLGVIASMQPTHCTSDMPWVEQRVGAQRAAGAYAWASLLRSGARIAAGSDFPVESHNPFLGVYAAVTRQDADGKPRGGWRAAERMSRFDALRAFTLDAAYASFEEGQKGSLAIGKLADFVVIDRDILSCSAAEIRSTRVLRTVIGGETVYVAEP